jgi:uroporphyrinogen-III synthase
MHVVMTRPQPGATAARWRGRGATVTVAPLLDVAARAWVPPAALPDAVAFTSANGVRLAGPDADRYHHLPVFAVGAATATAARDAGWSAVRDGGGTAAALFDVARRTGVGTLLHLAGVDRVAAPVPAGLTVTVREVYAASLLDLPAHVAALLGAGRVDAVLLYSARTAAHFAAAVDGAGIDRGGVALAALSPAVAAAAGSGWRAVAVATTPDDAALFAAVTALCDKMRPTGA